IAGHKIPNPGIGSFFYCGTKHMIRALTEGLRRELKATNSHIRVGSICPGIVETEFFVNYSSKISAAEASAYFKSFDPLRPKDIADSVLYILSAPPHVEVHDILIQPIENSI
ncbi:Dehydrogenase/reductase SDR family member 11, partial [Araneus ventricosus]